ncbi:hypothetical protein [Roseicyclus elongatus]|nr:hypothetical protein [Roseibacterium elongatum]
MLAGGLPTESFFPGAYSLSAMDQAVRSELLRLFPDLAVDGQYGQSARPSLHPWEGRLLCSAWGQAA